MASRTRFLTAPHVGQHVAIVDRDTFDRVQAALNEAGPADGARAKRATSALLIGLVFDAKGNRLQPSHSNKKGVRYHYYTSARRLRSASDEPQGVRVPAGDLERVVTSAVINRLTDKTMMLPWLTEHTATSDLPTLLARCADTAASIALSGTDAATIVQRLIDRVQVSKVAVSIQLAEEGLAKQLGVTFQRAADEPERALCPLHISITSHLLRCGKQVKRVLGRDAADQSDPNPKLIEMVVNARRWFASLLAGERTSIAQVAERAGLDRTYISRVITLAFLAPDIVEAILFGTHDASLTTERLRKACPLPMGWDDQGALLLA